MKRASLFDPFTGAELISEKEKKLFLLSPAYCNMLRKMVVGITSDHRITVYLLPPDYPELAFTDGSQVMINTLHQLFVTQPIDKITEYCLALAVHESLHPLYSCFQCVEDAATKKGNETDNIVQVRRELLNILEDARIERIGAYKFPGVAYAISSLNEYIYSIEKDISQMKDIEILLQWIMDFVSVDKNRGELTGDLGTLWEEIKPLAQMAKYSDTCSGCYFYTKKIMKKIRHLIPEQDPLNRQSQMPQTLQANAIDVDAKTGQQAPSHMALPGNVKVNVKNGAGNSGTQKGGSSNAGNSQNGNSGNGTGAGGVGGKGAGSGTADSNMSAALVNSINSSYKEHLEDVQNDKADKNTAANLRQESTSAYSVITNYGSAHEMDEYCRMKATVSGVCNQLKKGLKNVINYNVDEMSRYLHAGRVDPKSLSRMPSGAICAKRIEKNDEADLNLTLLVDLSSSMNSVMTEAIKACIVLQEVCMALKIPISILGFKSGNPMKIIHFSNRLLKGRYTHTGIVKMEAGGGTPLNPAMQYLPRLLKKQTEQDKMVIVITDGVPDGGSEACAATAKQLSKYAKVYGMDIGCGGEALVTIFGSNCIVVDSIEQLPKALCRVVQKNMLRR